MLSKAQSKHLGTGQRDNRHARMKKTTKVDIGITIRQPTYLIIGTFDILEIFKAHTRTSAIIYYGRRQIHVRDDEQNCDKPQIQHGDMAVQTEKMGIQIAMGIPI